MADEADRARELRRRAMPGGGEVVSGALATEALDAVGARAMTVDKTIFVAEDFDPSDPEDQALYAHERHHLRRSSGDDAHGGGKDAEELAAQAIERMVLQRRASGEELDSILRDVDQGRLDDPNHTGGAAEEPGTDGSDPMDAYRALRMDGWSHDAIVRLLVDHVLRELRAGEQDRSSRGPLAGARF